MQQQLTKKHIKILNALANVVNRKRELTAKSQRLTADEYGLHSSLLSRIESAKNEPKLFSLWGVAEALDLKLSELFALIEQELPEDFRLLD